VAARSLRINTLDYTAKTSLEEATSTKKGFQLQLDVIELHGGFALEPAQASIAYPPYTPCPQKLL
jgi:hypothetical protein